MNVWSQIASAAALESRLWAEASLAEDEWTKDVVFSPLSDPAYGLGIETIYEGYLVHYGHARLFSPSDSDIAILLGDYLYAHGLVRIADTGNVNAVADLAELISLCSQARADRRDGEGAAWAATAAELGSGTLEAARRALRERGDGSELEHAARARAGDAAVEQALAMHTRLVG